jgi:hypothetical protein
MQPSAPTSGRSNYQPDIAADVMRRNLETLMQLLQYRPEYNAAFPERAITEQATHDEFQIPIRH